MQSTPGAHTSLTRIRKGEVKLIILITKLHLVQLEFNNYDQTQTNECGGAFAR